MEELAWLGLIVAVIAAGVAIWQGVMAKQQLELARLAESNTTRTLSEIKDVSRDTLASVRQVEKDFEQRIDKFLAHQMKDLDLQLRAKESEQQQKEHDAQQGAEMAAGVMSFLGDAFKESFEESKRQEQQGDVEGLTAEVTEDDESDPTA